MKKKKRALKITLFSIFGSILLIIMVFCIALNGRISSMLSIKHQGGSLYTMKYNQKYHLDKALSSGIRNEEDLLNFICDDVLFGYKIDGNFAKYGCSAFATTTPDDKKIVGRSFDLIGSSTLCVYTHPKGGYASVSTVSTDMLCIGKGNSVSVRSFKGRAALLAAPYIGLDGMNEKGLSASLLDMSYGETHMDTDKNDIIVSLVIRLLLDRAANVNEAIELLKNYDLQTAHGWTQHVFVADKSGSSAIIEWVDGKMNVVDYHICTNFCMSELNGNYESQCSRFDFLDNFIDKDSASTQEEAMFYLMGVRQVNTVWSVVFNLSDFTLDYAVDGNYKNIYHLNPKKF